MEVDDWECQIQQEGTVVGAHSHVLVIWQVQMHLHVIRLGVEFPRIDLYPTEIIAFVDATQWRM